MEEPRLVQDADRLRRAAGVLEGLAPGEGPVLLDSIAEAARFEILEGDPATALVLAAAEGLHDPGVSPLATQLFDPLEDL